MELREELDKLIAKALDLKEQEMTQCVIKIQDIGNAYKYIGIVEDKSDYINQYDVDNEYSEGEQDPTIEYILCYHNDGEKIFYNEDGEELNLDMEEQEQFEKDYQDAINSKDNTVILDKNMIMEKQNKKNESLNETQLNRDIFCDGQFVVEKRRFDCGINPQNKVSITQLPAYMLPNIVAIEDDEPGYFKFIKQASIRDGEYSTVKQFPLTTKYCETRQDVAKEIIRLLSKEEKKVR